VISKSAASLFTAFVLRGFFALFFVGLAAASAQDYVFTPFAGTSGQLGDTDGSSGDARFRWPTSVCIDKAGNLFVVDRIRASEGPDLRPCVRKITPTGAVTTVYRHSAAGGFRGIAVAADGNLYVTCGHAVCRITPVGEFEVPSLSRLADAFQLYRQSLPTTLLFDPEPAVAIRLLCTRSPRR
jgi:hypothetical protein